MADDSRLSSVLDEEGRLFGLVNVIDALVVLLFLAVVIAGFALVAGPSGPSETRYVTLDLGSQPVHVADQISAGDRWRDVPGGGSLTIADVYMFPGSPGEGGGGDDEGTGGVNVVVRAQVNGTVIETDEVTDAERSVIEFDGEPLRFGRTLEIETLEYVVEGTVTGVEPTGETIATANESFVLQTEVSRETASDVQAGDEFRVGTTPLLRVESVTVYPTDDPEVRRLVLGVTASTRERGGTTLFGSRPLRSGTSIPLRTNAYGFTGQVIARGSLEEPGVPQSREVTVEIEQLSPDRANAIQVGASETVRRIETAVVTAKDEEPAEIVVQSSDGFTVLEHPRQRDVTLTISANVRELDDGTVRFRGAPLRVGQSLTLELEGVTVEGEVTNIEG
jgi:hypothetical protein